MLDKEIIEDDYTKSETNQDSINQEETQSLSLVEQLQLENDGLKQEVASKNDQLLRKIAEFENMRKRVERERYATFSLAKAEALNDFLPINDDLQRTIESSKLIAVDESFLKGVNLVAEKFENVLIKNGVEKINEINVPFDVNVHDALLKQPAPNAQTPSGTVLQIFEAGYKLGDRIIRHAKVIVSE